MRSTLQGLWKRRHLLWILVSSHLKRSSRSSALGLMWWFIDPLLMAGVYYVVVVAIFKRGGSHQPYVLFLVCSLFAWKSFSDTVSASVIVLKRQAPIIKAVSFPMAVLPFSHAIADTIFFGFSLVVAAGIASAYGPTHGTWPSFAYLLLVVPTAIQMVLAAGVALILSTLGVFFTDLQNIVRHLLRICFYLGPGLYDLDTVPERFRGLYQLNPFAGLMTSYREIIMQGKAPEAAHLLVPGVLAVLVFAVGYVLFRRYEGRFVQYV
ncbi:MAG: ABC transporter permease [Deltaproteobacteria bacterium]|nr:ABC transporter permease [Deltaproteobacteria bacterium]